MRNFLFSAWENLIYILVGVIVVNVVILDYFTFFGSPRNIVQNIQLGTNNSAQSQSSNQNSSTSSANTTSDQTQNTAQNSCPADCQTVIKNAIASITPVVVTSAPSQSQSTQTVSGGGAQEFFVPFGSSSGVSQGTYATLPALQAYVNMNQYTGVQTVTFEVSITIPNGNQTVYAQLYNSTDGYAIPNSQVNMSGGTPQLLISPNITLPAGNKLYQVQINTQLNASINIDQARLHITTN